MNHRDYFEKIRDNFLSALPIVHQTQEELLKSIINKNTVCEFGRQFGFSKIKTIEDFQKNVPVTQYEDYKPYIDEILKGEKNILTEEEVILLEPTSGSSSSLKLIPYTKSLKYAFSEGVNPWLSDLFLNFPDIINQPMYWSITPKIETSNINYKIKVGFDNDIDYLDGIFKKIISDNIIIPPEMSDNSSKFQKQTANFLAKYKNLGLISVWNPYLLILFIEKLREKPSNIWNNLHIISCWDEANSKIYFEKLREYFPKVKIQGKGLLATEAIMTIPIENIGKVPCIKSHFFEFIDLKTKEIKLLYELETGKNYSIIVTTQGGLYRYKIGDIVYVYDKYKTCPLLSFKGRENNISDYFGEKLNEDFVSKILEKQNIKDFTKFYMFAPKYIDNNFSYVLYIEPDRDVNFFKLQKNIEEELLKSFHYKYARCLGQIKEFKIYKIKNGMEQYIQMCNKKGQRIGDIKPKTFTNCAEFNFVGEFIV